MDHLQFAVDAGAKTRGVVKLLDVQIAPPAGDGAIKHPMDDLFRRGIDTGGIDALNILQVDVDHVGDIGVGEVAGLGHGR